MFHFPGCPPHELWIHSWVTGHYPGRVPPFGNSWINAYLQLPRTYRSLSRPSSAISALASTLRSSSLDLASTAIPFLRLLRWNCNLICEFPQRPLLTGIFRVRCFNSECLSLCSFQGAYSAAPRPYGRVAATRAEHLRFRQPLVGCFASSLTGCARFHSLPRSRAAPCGEGPCEPSKRYRDLIECQIY